MVLETIGVIHLHIHTGKHWSTVATKEQFVLIEGEKISGVFDNDPETIRLMLDLVRSLQRGETIPEIAVRWGGEIKDPKPDLI